MIDQPPKRINYDDLSADYNQRYVVSPPGRRMPALINLLKKYNARDVLEIGCGTGHWLEILSASGANLYGLDYSLGMLRQAKLRQGRIYLTRGDAINLPYPQDSFNLLYCIDALHHFGKPDHFIREAWRVLRPGGILALSGSDPHKAEEIWYVYDHFAGTHAYDLKRFPSRESIMAWLDQTGFQDNHIEILERIEHNYTADQVWEDPFLKKTACSQLAALDDAAYQAGIIHIQTAIEEAKRRNTTIVFRLVLPIHLITAQKPSQTAPASTSFRSSPTHPLD